MGDRMNNMNKMMQNPKSRNMYLTVMPKRFLVDHKLVNMA